MRNSRIAQDRADHELARLTLLSCYAIINDELEQLLLKELHSSTCGLCGGKGFGGHFLPALKQQVANVAARFPALSREVTPCQTFTRGADFALATWPPTMTWTIPKPLLVVRAVSDSTLTAEFGSSFEPIFDEKTLRQPCEKNFVGPCMATYQLAWDRMA
jgi:hypothetical protein